MSEETTAASTEPGTADETAKSPAKPKRVAYADLLTEEQRKDPALYPFKQVPADYDSKKHLPLKKKDFANEHDYYFFRADELEAKAKALREEGEEVKKSGGKKQQQSAKRLKAMQEKMAELRQQLLASGFTEEDIEKMTQGDD